MDENNELRFTTSLDTKPFIAEAKKLASEVNKALKVSTDNSVVQKGLDLLKAQRVEMTKQNAQISKVDHYENDILKINQEKAALADKLLERQKDMAALNIAQKDAAKYQALAEGRYAGRESDRSAIKNADRLQAAEANVARLTSEIAMSDKEINRMIESIAKGEASIANMEDKAYTFTNAWRDNAAIAREILGIVDGTITDTSTLESLIASVSQRMNGVGVAAEAAGEGAASLFEQLGEDYGWFSKMAEKAGMTAEELFEKIQAGKSGADEDWGLDLDADVTQMNIVELERLKNALEAVYRYLDNRNIPSGYEEFFKRVKIKLVEARAQINEFDADVRQSLKNAKVVVPDLNADVTKMGRGELEEYRDNLKAFIATLRQMGFATSGVFADATKALDLTEVQLKKVRAEGNATAKEFLDKPITLTFGVDADLANMNIAQLKLHAIELGNAMKQIEGHGLKEKDWEVYSKYNDELIKTNKAIRDHNNGITEVRENLERGKDASLGFADSFKLISDAIVSVGHANGVLEQLKAILLTIGPTAQMAGWMTKDALTMATAGINLLIEVASRLITIAESIGQAFKSLASTIWSAFTSALEALKKVANYLKNTLAKAADKVRSTFEKLHETFSFSVSGTDLKRMFQMLTKYIFGVRSFFFLYRKLRTGVKEGLENLVQFEHESNQTSKAILELKSSLLFLKNAWAAAFAPIINAVYPWLVSLLNLLARVGNAIARFVAALTGQSTVLQALRLDAEEYSDALDDLGGGADDASKKQDKLNDRLAAFDDLNVLGRDDDKNTTGGGGGGGGADTNIDPNEMFERVRVKMDELMRLLREAWETGDAFELGQMLAQRLSDSLDEAYTWLTKEGWDKVMKVARFIASLMDGLLSNDELPGKIGKVLAAAFDLGLTFIDTIITPERMYKIGVRIAEVFNEALPKIFPKIGEAIGNHFRSAISNAWGFISTADFASWGDALGEAINNFLEEMGTSKGILGGIEFTHSGWQLLGLSITELAKGILDFFIEAINTVDWNEVGKAIGDFLGSIDFETIKSGLMTLWDRIKEGLGEVWEGLGDSNPELATWLEPLVTVLQELPGLLTDIKDVLSSLFNPDGVSPEKRMAQITQFVQELPSKLEDFFDVLSRIADVLETVFGFIHDNSDEIVDTAVTGASAAGGSWLGSILGRIALGPAGIIAGGVTGGATGASVAKVVETINELQEEAERTNGIADVITASFGAIGNAFNLLGENAQIPGVHNAIMDLITTSLNAKDSINEMKGAFNFSDVTDNFNSMVSQAKGSLSEIPDKFTEIKGAAETRGNEMKGQFSTTFESIKSESVDSAKVVQDNFTLASDNIKTSFIGAWEEIKKSVSEGGSLFVALSDGMGNTVKSLLNGMIDGINVSITKPLQDISNSFNILRGLDVDGKKPFAGIPVLRVPTIPRLAQGAVIPPNREFMAVLGDQKSGTNIEAPLDTIRQAVGAEFAPYADAIVNAVMQVVQAVNDKPVISNRDIGRANAQYVSQQKLIRGTML